MTKVRLGIDVACRADHQASLADETGELVMSEHPNTSSGNPAVANVSGSADHAHLPDRVLRAEIERSVRYPHNKGWCRVSRDVLVAI